MPLVMALGSISTALALSRGGSLVFAGAMGFGTLAAFISYTTQLFDPIQQLARILAEMQSAQASAERVIDLLDTQPDIVDSPEVEAEYGTAFAPRRGNWPPIAGGVEFRDVTFAYKTGETVLRDFNLKVEPGQTIALVGETGAGKSTHRQPGVPFLRADRGPAYSSTVWTTVSAASSGCTPRWAMCCRRRTCSAAPLRTTSATAARTPPLEEVMRAAKPWCARDTTSSQALPDGYGTAGGRGRRPPFHRAKAACVLRPRGAGRPAHLRAGRGYQQHRHRDGTAHPERHPDGADRAAPASSWRTACPPSAARTRSLSSAAGASPRPAPTTSCWR